MLSRNLNASSIRLMLCVILLASFFPTASMANKTVIEATAHLTTPFSIPRSHTVQISDKARTYRLYIKLPKGYKSSANKDMHYPVIYLTDAMYTFQIMSGVTRFPMNSNQMAPAIIVGISWELGLKSDHSRVRDYTPTVDSSWKKITGGADRHLHFLKTKIIPYMEQNFRTDASQRTYVGNSLGGLFGAYILLQQPDLFTNYLIGSPSFWWHERWFLTQFAKNINSLTAIDANVFIGIGALEHNEEGGDSQHNMVADAQHFKALLNNLEISSPALNSKLLIIDEAHHATAFATTAIHGMDWLFNTEQGKSLKSSIETADSNTNQYKKLIYSERF
ncbi:MULTISPECIES: alpha/beta hydrolase [unclassified Shewanella]|uniref:alpha/beta hydrolase n=1 Tax=unclassified Shewanella TaxID=196818 RepID=UPI001BC055C1|nr:MULTISPECIES: alpha/beta hydrolase-fold protein [unclassified Shewanella]GIU16317.1 esterase [Shewanella sp. MBTL60-112-B1]GIU36745.1 esterase [Shewanella sp. MBTL60-112-B2]